MSLLSSISGIDWGQNISKNDMPGPGLTAISEVCRGWGRGLGEFSRGQVLFTQYFTKISEQISIILLLVVGV